MKTEGTMKMVVFERNLSSFSEIGDAGAMRAYADLLGEAAEWIRSEMVRPVQVSAKKKEMHRVHNVMVGFTTEAILESSSADYAGETLRLYLHYDDNEKG